MSALVVCVMCWSAMCSTRRRAVCKDGQDLSVSVTAGGAALQKTWGGEQMPSEAHGQGVILTLGVVGPFCIFVHGAAKLVVGWE